MYSHRIINSRCDVVEIPPEDSLQIDNPFDLALADYILKNRGEFTGNT